METITLKYQKNKSHEIHFEDLKINYENESKKWKVEVEEKNALFFMEEYKEAIEMVNAIIASCNGQEEVEEEEEEKEEKKERRNRSNKAITENESINNRILFVGQRGTGKTSAMTSFAKGMDKAKLYKKNVFKCLPLIDPSNFDNNTNILLTVITMMFSEAKKLMKNGKNDEDIISKREELLKKFDEVFKSLKAITGSDKPTFTLEGLNEKSRALQMRTGMHSLVKSYIDFYNEVNETNLSHLVLMIDDIDMTVSHIPEMLEQLRKYLDIDNLLILMSANLGQLYNEMHEHYSKAFKETLNDRNRALSIDVEDLASKYLLKLFPTSRRIRVEHSVSQMINSDIEVKDEKGTVISSGKLQNVILSLIWQRTRLLFVPKDADTMLHPIIPTNLRELMQFLDMLTSLKEVEYKDKKGKEEPRLFWDVDAFKHCEENVEKFKKYILQNWIPNRLSVEEEMVFDNIPTDITEINKHLINAINMIGTRHKTDLMAREVALDMIERNAEDVNIDRDIYTMVSPNDPKFVKANKISDIFNQPSNYSYGDLLLIIDKYETYFESENDRKFTDAIKIYYSILLFETMFFKSTDVNYNKPKDSIDLNDLLIPIQKLIGGTVYYPNYFEIITDKHFNQKGPSFDAKRAFYHKLPVDNEHAVGEGYPFYAVLYYGDIRPDRYDTKHIYDTTFNNDARIDGTDYVTFDILSILSNMLNPWHTYKRANENVNKPESWTDTIDAWSRNCEITKEGNYAIIKEEKNKHDDSCIYIPNSILPFYSLDMMLQYLKQSQSSQKVYSKSSPGDLDSIVTMRDKYMKSLFGANKKPSKTSLWEWFVKRNDEKKSKNNKDDIELFCNDLINVKIDNENKIKVTKKTTSKIGNVSPFNDDILMEIISNEPGEMKSEVEVLLNNLFIISKIFVCYKKHSICPPLHGVRNTTEPFKNYVIAVLLNHYSGGKKNLNTLIKDLYKCETVAETYRLVVDYLWINTVNEILIRSKIQKVIRENKSVGRYYVILWSETAKMLSVIARPEEKRKMKADILEKNWMDFFASQDDEKANAEDKIQKMKEMMADLGNSDAIASYLKLFMEAKKAFIDKKA